jgi:tRNA U34 2-thiouridine synthase MnmA/TrmU
MWHPVILASMDRLISAISKIREVKNINDLKPNAPLHVMLKDLDGNTFCRRKKHWLLSCRRWQKQNGWIHWKVT